MSGLIERMDETTISLKGLLLEKGLDPAAFCVQENASMCLLK